MSTEYGKHIRDSLRPYRIPYEHARWAKAERRIDGYIWTMVVIALPLAVVTLWHAI